MLVGFRHSTAKVYLGSPYVAAWNKERKVIPYPDPLCTFRLSTLCFVRLHYIIRRTTLTLDPPKRRVTRDPFPLSYD